MSVIQPVVSPDVATQLINLPGSFYVSDSAVGDGNVHLNVLPCCDKGAEKVVTAVLDRYAGSISAAHGIERFKKSDFDARLPAVQRHPLTVLKQAIDPHGTMNPGCVFDMS